ncbi:MAG: outer membrane beta-barrel protein [Methylacidiphilales bacterium]|nr:outer membrane beta-barrel protein [Candidatus Methylacidiphilales bacterium]
MKKTSKWMINGQHRLGISWRRGMTCLVSGVLLGFFSSLFADVPDTGTGIAAPSGTYSSPEGIVAPSGTYASPSNALAPTTSPSSAPFMESGHLPILFIATVSEVYDDNIFVQPNKVSDFITQISLLGEYKIGNDKAIDASYFDIFYAPSVDIYADHSGQDSFNQRAGLLYQYRFSKLALGLEQTYARESATSAAAGNLVTSSVYVTKASADYNYSDKLSVIGDFTQTLTDYETAGFSYSNEWAADAYFLYQLDPKLSIGFGPTVGWLDLGYGAPSQTYQQMLARVNYLYSGKLSFNLSAGAEVREYSGSVTGDTVEPVFSLSGTYQPFINTNITLVGQRQFDPSYNFYGQDYIATSVSLIGRQRFLQKFYYNVGFGYENDSYQGAGIDLTGPARDDDYYYATTGFDWDPNSWLKASIFYKYQKDDSSFSNFSFTDNQVGVSASFSY